MPAKQFLRQFSAPFLAHSGAASGVHQIFEPFLTSQAPETETVENMFAVAGVEVADTDVIDKRLHKPIAYRSVFFSDVHLGTVPSLHRDVIQFLDHVKPEYLFGVGDLFDTWQMGGLLWAVLHRLGHSTVVQKILKHVRHAAKFVLIPGNHDDDFRLGLTKNSPINGVIVCDEATHQTANGLRMLVLHGDVFDGVVRNYRWLGILGTRANEWLAEFSVFVDKSRAYRPINKLFHLCGVQQHWSLAHKIRTSSDGMAYSEAYRHAAIGYLFRKNAEICAWNKTYPDQPALPYFDAILCGHTHIAAKIEVASPRDEDGKSIGPETVMFLNTGCWVGRPGPILEQEADQAWRDELKYPVCTAVVEQLDGRLQHVQWVPGVGIVPLEERFDDGSFKNLTGQQARERVTRLGHKHSSPEVMYT